jgi:hypothetical protein
MHETKPDVSNKIFNLYNSDTNSIEMDNKKYEYHVPQFAYYLKLQVFGKVATIVRFQVDEIMAIDTF